jgi:hypothetical protein
MRFVAAAPRGAFLPHQSRLVQLLEQCASVCRAWPHMEACGSTRTASRRMTDHSSHGAHGTAASAMAAVAAAVRPPSRRSQKRSRRRPAPSTSVGQATGMHPGQMLELECDSLAFGGQVGPKPARLQSTG